MNARTIGVIALCAVLAGCGSKPANPDGVGAEDPVKTVESAAPAAFPEASMKPAPEGLPSRVAREAIAASGQKCDNVAKADRSPQDGTITASCSGGESYRIYNVDGKGVTATKL